MGRASLRLRRTQERHQGDGRRGDCFRARTIGEIQGAAHGLIFRTAQDLDGQDSEVRASGTREEFMTVPPGRRSVWAHSPEEGTAGSVNGASQPLELIFNSEFLFF